jgi:hypothetical protein
VNIDKVYKGKVEEDSKLPLVEVKVVKEVTAREQVGANEKVVKTRRSRNHLRRPLIK